jgi:outer membrane receptor protein involved in Fe transport
MARLSLTSSFCVLPLALLAGPALAQSADTSVLADTLRRQRLDEVVVTATRTEKSLADVAIPVSVIGAKQLRSMGKAASATRPAPWVAARPPCSPPATPASPTRR